MANVQKITLASSRDIPFHKLVLSQSNVRRVKAGISVKELAESIARRGLFQSLHVCPVLDADGAETGSFEVPAGGRRYRALELLVKQKRLAKTAAVPCIVSAADGSVLIDEVSLAGNIERAPLACASFSVPQLTSLMRRGRPARPCVMNTTACRLSIARPRTCLKRLIGALARSSVS